METTLIKRVALYARVSTLNGQNPEMQLAELREYAQRRGWTVHSEYVDLGVSGAKENRPQLNRMLKMHTRESSTRSSSGSSTGSAGALSTWWSRSRTCRPTGLLSFRCATIWTCRRRP